MRTKIKDFLGNWYGKFRVEDRRGSVYGDQIQSLSSELLEKEIISIRLDEGIWNGKECEVLVLTIDNTEEPKVECDMDYPAEHYVIAVDQSGMETEAYIHVFEAAEQIDIEALARLAAVEYCRTPEGAKAYQESGRCFNWGDFTFIPDGFCKKYGFRKRFFTPVITVDLNEKLVMDEDLNDSQRYLLISVAGRKISKTDHPNLKAAKKALMEIYEIMPQGYDTDEAWISDDGMEAYVRCCDVRYNWKIIPV